MSWVLLFLWCCGALELDDIFAPQPLIAILSAKAGASTGLCAAAVSVLVLSHPASLPTFITRAKRYICLWASKSSSERRFAAKKVEVYFRELPRRRDSGELKGLASQVSWGENLLIMETKGVGSWVLLTGWGWGNWWSCLVLESAMVSSRLVSWAVPLWWVWGWTTPEAKTFSLV